MAALPAAHAAAVRRRAVAAGDVRVVAQHLQQARGQLLVGAHEVPVRALVRLREGVVVLHDAREVDA
eukprot:CAMPEP_0118866292 /NCGR_PEP_ID=MMETSP1163-20130328/10257_1 /TAXON_ID=124430 /ORGANISM="Phaeomonas parva, Strain CCMP2877" /LENGTH=66 /DNA_ID=CAMNT_0006800593 /DNA_START=113 /DNA_END=309 /DNA_ORIENTATION=+